MARGSRQDFMTEKLSFIPSVNGDCIVHSDEDFAEAAQLWESTLIGVVMGTLISQSVHTNFIMRNWKIALRDHEFHIKDTGIIVLRFKSLSDRDWVSLVR